MFTFNKQLKLLFLLFLLNQGCAQAAWYDGILGVVAVNKKSLLALGVATLGSYVLWHGASYYLSSCKDSRVKPTIPAIQLQPTNDNMNHLRVRQEAQAKADKDIAAWLGTFSEAGLGSGVGTFCSPQSSDNEKIGKMEVGKFKFSDMQAITIELQGSKNSWLKLIDVSYITWIQKLRSDQKAIFDRYELSQCRPAGSAVQFYVEPTVHANIQYPFEARFKIAAGENLMDFDRERIVDVEGCWSDSTYEKDRYPSPQPIKTVDESLAKFIAKFNRIEKVAEFQFGYIADENKLPKNIFFSRARIVKSYWRKNGYGPHCRLCGNKNLHLSANNYVDRVSMIAWQGGYSHYLSGECKSKQGEAQYVKPSREIYRYVINFPEEELQKMENMAEFRLEMEELRIHEHERYQDAGARGKSYQPSNYHYR